MNPDTGAIAEFETEEDAKKAGYTVPLSKEEARKLRIMPRDSRLGLISDAVKALTAAHPDAHIAGMSNENIRKIRNAAKRARRSRR